MPDGQASGKFLQIRFFENFGDQSHAFVLIDIATIGTDNAG
jgi:hypothetical protein